MVFKHALTTKLNNESQTVIMGMRAKAIEASGKYDCTTGIEKYKVIIARHFKYKTWMLAYTFT